jgi:hypothetical protein
MSLRKYQGTAAVGDFLDVVIDPTAMTLTYSNAANNTSGVVPYTVAADGSYDFHDPDGNVLRGIELPNYALVLDLDHAGPHRDTRSFAFAIQKTPISVATVQNSTDVVMQFRTAEGGMNVGCATITWPTVNIDEYWPYALLTGETPYRHSSGTEMNIHDDPSGTFLVVPEADGQFSYVFGTPSGMMAIDNPNGNMIAFPQPLPGDPDTTAGEYASLIYNRKNVPVNTGPTPGDGGAQDGGDGDAGYASASPSIAQPPPSIDKVKISVDQFGFVTVTDETGAVVDRGRLSVDLRQLPGTGQFQDPCSGLFLLDQGARGNGQLVFLAFVDRAVLIASFFDRGDGHYDYFYGAGLKH